MICRLCNFPVGSARHLWVECSAPSAGGQQISRLYNLDSDWWGATTAVYLQDWMELYVCGARSELQVASGLMGFEVSTRASWGTCCFSWTPGRPPQIVPLNPLLGCGMAVLLYVNFGVAGVLRLVAQQWAVCGKDAAGVSIA